jgi:hypothetical protein
VSVACVVQVEVSAAGRSLVQRSPTECGMSECDCKPSTIRRPRPTEGCCTIIKIIRIINTDGRTANSTPTIHETLQRDRVKYFARETTARERGHASRHNELWTEIKGHQCYAFILYSSFEEGNKNVARIRSFISGYTYPQ